MPEYVKKEKIERKDVIIELIRDISKKALTEFKGGYTKTVVHGDWVEEVYIPDSRKEYIQGIEFLTDMLLPDFDKTMKEKEKDIRKEIEGILKKYEAGEIEQGEYVIEKLKLIRKLFRQLNLFLDRIKFFKRKTVVG